VALQAPGTDGKSRIGSARKQVDHREIPGAVRDREELACSLAEVNGALTPVVGA
jgi:hypothetical protein